MEDCAVSSYYEKILATGEVKCIDEEVPFEIPQGWEWCRLGEISTTFKLLWVSSSMYEPYVLAFIRFYKETLRNSKKGAAIPHLNKDHFYGLIIGIPPLQEQRRIVQKIEQSSKLLK